jgi:hypothetical protein
MSDLLRLVTFPFRPAGASEEVRRHPRWAVAFLVLAALTVGGGMALHPYEVAKTLASLPASADTADQMHMREYLDASLPVRLAFVPFRLFLDWSATALALWALVRAFRSPYPVRFVQILALEVHAETVNVAGLLMRVALVTAGVTASAGEEALPLNALMLFGGAHDYILRTLLTSINLHTLWYVWIVGHGVSVLCGYKKPTAFFFSAVTWAMALGLNLAIIRLLWGALHLGS